MVVVALVYGALALFAPLTLANLYDGAGNYKISMVYYERQYEKTSSQDDLYTLCLKVDEYNDSARAKDYLGRFVDNSSQTFNDYCAVKDGANFNGLISTKEYIYGKLVTAVCKADGVDKAIELAGEITSIEYTDYNPYYVLINDSVLRLDGAALSFIKVSIETKIPSLTGTQLTNAQNDLAVINGLLN